MSDVCAAIDLGSNSFRLLLAGRRGDELVVLEQLKDKVQLLGGFRDGLLQADALDRAEEALDRFAQRVASVPRDQLWVIGTHALRAARNADPVARAVRDKLGVQLRVVSGVEEANLIYLGVSHHYADDPGAPRLVVDIGGGSTELAWGVGSQCQHPVSAAVGCVALKDRHFGDPHATNGELVQAFCDARQAAVQELEALRAAPSAEAVTRHALGTSGTIESVQAVLAANGWDGPQITNTGLQRLVDALLAGRWLPNSGLPGLAPERLDIFPAGVALLSALFEVLGLEAMSFVNASLQDGVLYRHVAPHPAEDLRGKTIKRLGRRYQVDPRQAARVRATALELFAQVRHAWNHTDTDAWLLAAAADLHEVGLTVAPKHYHRHGGYLLQHADLPGVTAQQQRELALLVRAHRRALPLLAVGGMAEERLLRLLILLRLAVIMHRGHDDADPPRPRLAVSERNLELGFAGGWLRRHALSARELEVEIAQLAEGGWCLAVGSSA